MPFLNHDGMIENLIEQFFARNNYCPLPGIGTIKLERDAAQVSWTDGMISAPAYSICLIKENRSAENFVFFISNTLKTDLGNANHLLTDYCDKIIALQPGQETRINLTGNFIKEDNGSLSFHPEKIPASYSPTVAAQRVIHPDAVHHVRVGDQEHSNVFMAEYLNERLKVKKSKWIISAAAIAALALGIIAFNFYRSGLSSGNANSLDIQPASSTYQTAQ